MSNASYSSYPTYQLNKSIPAALASLIRWVIQSVRIRFKPYRIKILLLVSHSTVFASLAIRAVYSDDIRSATNVFTAAGMLLAIASAIITGIETQTLFNADTIDRAFQFRQAAAALVLSLTGFFYPIWLVIKPILNINKQAIVLLLISSLSCLIVTIYILISSIPQYYYQANEVEHWFYIFQVTPTISALLTWTVCYSKQSLEQVQP